MMNKFRVLLLVAFMVPSIVLSQVPLTATGSSNTFNVTYPANISAISAGMMVTFFSNQTITGNTFLNLNGLGSRPILKNVNQPLAFGDMLSGQAVTVIYDGTNWQLLSTSNSTGLSGGGIANGVAIWQNSSSLTSDGTNLFWDNTNKRLGIGNNVPGTALAVNGAITIDNGNTNDGTAATFPSSALRLGNSNSIGISSQKTVGTNQNGIDFWTAGSIRMQLQNTGFVGIGGNFTAATRLHQHEASSAANYFKLTNNNTATTVTDGTNFGIDISGNTEIRNYEFTGINFFTNNVQRMSISNSGVLQIPNLVGPGVVQADASGNLSIGSMLSGSGTSGGVAFFANNTTLTTNVANFFWDNSNKRLGLGTSTPTSVLTIPTVAANEIEFPSSGNNADIVSNGQFNIGSSGSTLNLLTNSIYRLTISNAGQVGIGTISPGNTLDIGGGIRVQNLSAPGAVFSNSSGDLYVSSTSGASAWTISGSNIFPQNASWNVGIGLGSVTTPGILAGASRYITLAANQTNTTGFPSVELLSINGTLNSPVSKLDFINVYTPALSLFANHARIQAFTGRGAVANGQLGFFTSNGSMNEVMRINENGGVSIGSAYTPNSPPVSGLMVQGNFGLGTTVPGAKFHIKSSTSASPNLAMLIQNAGGSNILSLSDNGLLGLGTNLASRAPFEQYGSVGSTAAMFGITGTGGVSLISNYPGIAFNGYYAAAWTSIGSGYGADIDVNPADGLISINTFSNAASANSVVTATPRMAIMNSGNVGIGTITPNSTLQLIGSVSLKTAAFSSGAALTLTTNDCVVFLGATGGTAVTLPAASTCNGRIYIIKVTNGGTHTITNTFIPLTGGAAISSIATAGSYRFISDGTSWHAW